MRIATSPGMCGRFTRQTDGIRDNRGDSGGEPYAEDVTIEDAFEQVGEPVHVPAPARAMDFLHVRRVEAKVGVDSLGSGSVVLGYDWRFGSDAFSSIAVIGTYSFSQSVNHCANAALGPTLGRDVRHRGQPGQSFDARFYLRRASGGVNVAVYCIEDARVLYDERWRGRVAGVPG